jgi:hypothetical protein
VKAKTGRRATIQPVLDAEVERWSKKTCEELAAQLKEEQNYEVGHDSKRYQVEVQLLENTNSYVHVMVCVDDGTLGTAISPSSRTFIRSRHSDFTTPR